MITNVIKIAVPRLNGGQRWSRTTRVIDNAFTARSATTYGIPAHILELRLGLEPRTYALQVRCAANCAIEAIHKTACLTSLIPKISVYLKIAVTVFQMVPETGLEPVFSPV